MTARENPRTFGSLNGVSGGDLRERVGWALDRSLKVFWYERVGCTLVESITYLLPQLAVLSAMALVFLGIARWLARRWETV